MGGKGSGRPLGSKDSYPRSPGSGRLPLKRAKTSLGITLTPEAYAVLHNGAKSFSLSKSEYLESLVRFHNNPVHFIASQGLIDLLDFAHSSDFDPSLLESKILDLLTKLGVSPNRLSR